MSVLGLGRLPEGRSRIKQTDWQFYALDSSGGVPAAVALLGEVGFPHGKAYFGQKNPKTADERVPGLKLKSTSTAVRYKTLPLLEAVSTFRDLPNRVNTKDPEEKARRERQRQLGHLLFGPRL